MKTFNYSKKMLLFALLLGCSVGISAQQITVTGRVSDKTNGEALAYANVIATDSNMVKAATTTDLEGKYSLSLPKGLYNIAVAYISYNTTRFDNVIIKDTMITLNFEVEQNTQVLKSMEIVEYAIPLIDVSNNSKCTVSSAYMSSGSNRFRANKKNTNNSTNTSTTNSTVSNYASFIAYDEQAPINGSLTAGQINDFGKWELWSDISSNDLQKAQNIWKIYPLNRYSVLVSSEKGIAVVDAEVILKDIDGKALWTAHTDNTGKAELWVGMLNEKTTTEKSICVVYNGQDYSISKPLKFSEGINMFNIPVECKTPEMVDIAVVVDATGSMDDEILYLKSELMDILNKTKINYPDLSLNLGSIFYRCPGNSYVTKKSDFSTDILQTINFISTQFSGEGGEEAVEQALDVAINQLEWSKQARARILLLVLDEPPSTNDTVVSKLQKVLKEAAAKGIRVVAVVGSGEGIDKDRNMEYLMRSFALGTNGSYVFLTDHSLIGNAHTKPVTDEYDVELLNDMLLRLIYEYTFVADCNKPLVDKNVEDTMYVYNPKVIAHVVVKSSLLGNYDLFEKPDTLLSVFSDSSSTALSNSTVDDTAGSDSTILAKAEDIKKEKFRNFKYYPNPTSGELFIEFDGKVKELFLADIGGKLLEKYQPEENNLKIDLSSYPAGVYFLQYFYNEKWLSGKVIKN